MENKIIAVARETFLEKGYAETSMSEIASRVGINRPTLHYYFRTKDKMFQAVLGNIVSAIIPRVFEELINKDKPIAERIEGIINAYYNILLENPHLPLFLIRELNRDADLLIKTVNELNVVETMNKGFISVQEEMKEGKLNDVSLQFAFYNLYGLLFFPFITKGISQKVFNQDQEQFKQMLLDWKQTIIKQMQNLLEKK